MCMAMCVSYLTRGHGHHGMAVPLAMAMAVVPMAAATATLTAVVSMALAMVVVAMAVVVMATAVVAMAIVVTAMAHNPGAQPFGRLGAPPERWESASSAAGSLCEAMAIMATMSVMAKKRSP